MGRVIGFRAAAVAAGALLLAAAAAADGVSLEAGEWRIEQTTRTPVQAEPQVRVSEVCVTEPDFTPDRLVTEDHGTCQFSDVDVQDGTMTWSIDCPDAESSGTGVFIANGLTASGEMLMNVQVQGQAMSFTVEWSAQHVGSC